MDKYGGVGGVGGLVLLLLAAILHAAHTEFAFSFQNDETSFSVDEYAYFNKKIPAMASFTICYWEFIKYFSQKTTISPFAFCHQGPSSKDRMKCLQMFLKPDITSMGSKVYYFLDYGKIGGQGILFNFTVDYRHRTWNHFCIRYDNLTFTFLYNGDLVGEKRHYFSGINEYFQQFLIFGQEPDSYRDRFAGANNSGGFDHLQVFQGKISRFNWWNKSLSMEEMAAFAKCRGPENGNIVNWQKNNFQVDSNLIEKVDGRQFCRQSEKWVLFAGRRKHRDALILCKAHNGWIVVPRSGEENAKAVQLYLNTRGCTPECSRMIGWLGVHSYEGKTFISARGKVFETSYQHFRKGLNVPDNITTMRDDGKWEAFQETLELCTICAFPVSQPVLYLKGLCNSARIDWVYYPEQNNKGQLVYKGYKNTIIMRKNETWRIVDRVGTGKGYSVPSFKDVKMKTPVGRNWWLFDDAENLECEDFGANISLTLSPCELSKEFTCGNGVCIPIEKRCDFVNDCSDKSDEFYCKPFEISSTYNKYMPPYSNGNGNKNLDMQIHFDVLSVNEFLLEKNKIDISYRIIFTWKEDRICYLNINNETPFTKLPTIEKHIWNPLSVLSQEFAGIGSVEVDQSSKEINAYIETPPDPSNSEHSFEDRIYKGYKGILEQKARMTGVYSCLYDIFRYPFNQQQCTIKLSFKETPCVTTNSSKNSVRFRAHQYLSNFMITDWIFFSKEDATDNSSQFGFTIKFKHLYLNQITQVYFQVELVWIVAYLTLFIDVHDFGNRFMGSVTSLLVLCTLTDNINNRLPSSRSIRLIDIWNITYIFQIIFIILFHIGIDKAKISKPDSINTNAKVLLPIVHLVFIFYYLVHNFAYNEEES